MLSFEVLERDGIPAARAATECDEFSVEATAADTIIDTAASGVFWFHFLLVSFSSGFHFLLVSLSSGFIFFWFHFFWFHFSGFPFLVRFSSNFSQATLSFYCSGFLVRFSSNFSQATLSFHCSVRNFFLVVLLLVIFRTKFTRTELHANG